MACFWHRFPLKAQDLLHPKDPFQRKSCYLRRIPHPKAAKPQVRLDAQHMRQVCSKECNLVRYLEWRACKSYFPKPLVVKSKVSCNKDVAQKANVFHFLCRALILNWKFSTNVKPQKKTLSFFCWMGFCTSFSQHQVGKKSYVIMSMPHHKCHNV